MHCSLWPLTKLKPSVGVVVTARILPKTLHDCFNAACVFMHMLAGRIQVLNACHDVVSVLNACHNVVLMLNL